MPTTGPNFPTAATGNTTAIGGGNQTWTTPTNIEASDGVFTTCAMTAILTISDDLIGTGFGFAVAGTDTINGILLEVNYKASSGSVVETNVRLLKAGVAAGTDKSTGATLPTTSATASYGSAADLWGTTWTPTDINNANFGAAVVYTDNGAANRTVSIDFMRITITSTAAGGGTNTAKMLVMF